ncbi:tetratricopeptide repeat protein [Streptomyces sp. NBC_01288]|uniref:tetratricopeptide repeat protein n=1 Tax=Streptomyces sp. NBC_01288 TaxID=2903814 RepID=UPI002E116317|nr:tetratricopeptide repeat protein [Streptomyces sp. NBC_01288]
MTQQQEPQENTGTYEEMLQAQTRALNSLRVRAGNPAYRTIEKRAAALFADEGQEALLPGATLNKLFNGGYAGREKLLSLVRTLMSWDRYGRDCEPPGYGDPELEPWNERWTAITEAKKSRPRPPATPDPITVIDGLLRQAHEQREAGDLGRAEDCYRSAIDLAIEHRARQKEGWAWDGLGSCHWRDGDPEMALKFFTRANRIADETDDRLLKAWSLYNFGMYWRRRPELAKAKDFFERALTVANTHQCYAAAGWTHHELAELARDQGETHLDWEHYGIAAQIGLESDDDVLAGWSMTCVGKCAERSGELEQARDYYARALGIGARIHHQDMVHKAEEGLARLTDPH